MTTAPTLREALNRVVEHYEVRSDLYTSDAECAGGMADIARIALSAQVPEEDDAGLVERLRKRADQDEACAKNSKAVLDLLEPEYAKFNKREAPWNTYAVRMAVDHEQSAKRDTNYAADLRLAAARLEMLGSRPAKQEESR